MSHQLKLKKMKKEKIADRVASKQKYMLGFFNSSASKQDWALFLDGTSVATFSLDAGKGTPKYVAVDFEDGDVLDMTVDTTDQNATAKLTRTGDKLKLTSVTPNEWTLDQETGTQYLVTCKLS
jgi:hypothetical protein